MGWKKITGSVKKPKAASKGSDAKAAKPKAAKKATKKSSD